MTFASVTIARVKAAWIRLLLFTLLFAALFAQFFTLETGIVPSQRIALLAANWIALCVVATSASYTVWGVRTGKGVLSRLRDAVWLLLVLGIWAATLRTFTVRY